MAPCPRPILVILTGAWLVTCPAALAASAPPHPVCATEHVWAEKNSRTGAGDSGAACAGRGDCDNPAIRDATGVDAVTVRLIVHVMANAEGQVPNGATRTAVDAAIAELSTHFSDAGIDFVHETRVHADARFYCIRSYSPFNFNWQQDIVAMKRAYAETPESALNIFVSCQNGGTLGSLLGYSTFPWDADALTADGGVWVNSAFFGAGNHALTHEVGHALGLWHTHHGTSEMAACDDACTETVHATDDPAADWVGDLCRDTPASPTHYDCEAPAGEDCAGTPWDAFGPVDVTNFMGYGRDDCTSHFTPNQASRMHCWVTHALASLITQPVDVAHIASVGLSVGMSGGKSRAQATVSVVDALGSPVAGAIVRARWSGSSAGEQRATTAQDGRAIFQSAGTSHDEWCWTLTVLGVSGERIVYDDNANRESSDHAGNSCPPKRVHPDGGGVVSLSNHPNPFNPTTTLRFTLSERAHVTLRVFDVAGASVANLIDETRDTGTYEVVWNGRGLAGTSLPSGVYYARLTAGDVVRSHRIVLVK